MRNFIIVGTQRTGSSALAESLGLYSGITCGWEWTLKMPRTHMLQATERALSGDFSALPKIHQEHMARAFDIRRTEWLGFRRLFSSSYKWVGHPRFALVSWIEGLESHLQWLAERPDVFVIHIIRRDHIAWLRSLYLAKKTKIYVGRQYPGEATVRIPLWQAVKRVRSKQWVDERLSSLSSSNPYLQIDYEDFFQDRANTVAQALSFLGKEYEESDLLAGKIQKQSTGSIADNILNYNEIYKKLIRMGLMET